MDNLREIWAFLRVRKRYWLAPFLVVFFLLALLTLAVGALPVISPFIYSLF